MDSMLQSLPQSLQAFVQGQVADGGYASASAYVHALIRADERRQAETTLETLLLDGLASAESPWTSEDLAAIRGTASPPR